MSEGGCDVKKKKEKRNIGRKLENIKKSDKSKLLEVNKANGQFRKGRSDREDQCG